MDQSVMFVREDSGRIVAQPSCLYPRYLSVLGLSMSAEVTQVSLETARLMFTEDLCKVFGCPLHLVIVKDEKYRLTRYPKGEGSPRKFMQDLYPSLPGTPAKRLGIV